MRTKVKIRKIDKNNLLKLLLTVFVITLVIIGINKISPQSKAEENSTISIDVTYTSENNGNTSETIMIDNDTKGGLLLDFGKGGTSSWTSSNIEGTYTDSSGNIQTATYKASFAGWKLVSINGSNVTSEYIYPDNDYIYMDDEPFASYPNITSLTFEALWGKTVYVRDEYNFVDITNVYGYNVEGTTGDILTAKINWDTSQKYSSDYYSGATKEEPVSSITKAYELLKNSYGGKIYIVNHITLEAPESYYAYSEGFKNSGQSYNFELGQNLNISGVVTISGENMGSGTTVENKVNGGGTFLNSYMYVKNTRGAGLYNGKTTYASLIMQMRFHTNTVLEEFTFTSYRENYNSNGARQTAESYIYNTANCHLLIEDTFLGYKRTTSQGYLGLDAGNWSHTTTEGIVGSSIVNFSALASGLQGCTYIYGSTNAYTAPNKNIYLTIKGGISWYYVMGINASTGGTAFGNMHLSFENVSIGYLWGTYGGKVTSSNNVTIYTNNVTVSTFATTYNSNINANKINIIIGKDGTKRITNLYGGGYNTTTYGTIYKVNAELNIKVGRWSYNKPLWWWKSGCNNAYRKYKY